MEYGIHSVFFFFFPSNHVVSTVSSRKGPGRGKRDVVKRRRSPFLCVEISGKEGKKREEREKRERREKKKRRSRSALVSLTLKTRKRKKTPGKLADVFFSLWSLA